MPGALDDYVLRLLAKDTRTGAPPRSARPPPPRRRDSAHRLLDRGRQPRSPRRPGRARECRLGPRSDRDASQLHKHATAYGDPYAAATLVGHLHTLHRTDHHPAQWATTHAVLDDPSAVRWLLGQLQEIGAEEQLTALLTRDPVAHVALDDPWAVTGLLDRLREVGAEEQVTALAKRVAAHVALDNASAVGVLLGLLQAVGAEGQVIALAERAAAHAFAEEQVTALLARDPAAHIALGNPYAVGALLGRLQEIGAEEQVTALVERAADHVAVDDPSAVAWLLDWLWAVAGEEHGSGARWTTPPRRRSTAPSRSSSPTGSTSPPGPRPASRSRRGSRTSTTPAGGTAPTTGLPRLRSKGTWQKHGEHQRPSSGPKWHNNVSTLRGD